MSDLVTSAYPATLSEAGYARAEREHRPWYVVYRPAIDGIGVTPVPLDDDEVISTCEPE